jgi:hypothetical protein
MALRVTQLALWMGPIADQTGGAAAVLKPMADAKVDLEFVLARRTPEAPGQGILFVAPVTGSAAEQAASAAGLHAAEGVTALRVEGDNRAGEGYALTAAIAAAGISFRGLSASVLGNRFTCYLAFDSADDAAKAAKALDAVSAPAAKAAKPKAPAKKAKKKSRR